MLRRLFVIFVILVVMLACVQSAAIGAIKARILYTVGYDSSQFSINKGDVPAAVIAEGNNPVITNPYSGHVFDKTRIGTFDATKVHPMSTKEAGARFAGIIAIDLGTETGTSTYLRLNVPVNVKFDNANGNYGTGYAYEKLFSYVPPVDYVRYIYGVVMKQSLVQPEIGIRFRKKNLSDSDHDKVNEIGVSFRTLSTKFYKGIEAYGAPENLIELGSVKKNIVVLHLRTSISDSSLGLSFPLAGAKGIALTVTRAWSK